MSYGSDKHDQPFKKLIKAYENDQSYGQLLFKIATFTLKSLLMGNLLNKNNDKYLPDDFLGSLLSVTFQLFDT